MWTDIDRPTCPLEDVHLLVNVTIWAKVRQILALISQNSFVLKCYQLEVTTNMDKLFELCQKGKITNSLGNTNCRGLVGGK